MASFQFKVGDVPVSLATVDEYCCLVSGVECHPTRCCALYDTVINLGFDMLLAYGGSSITGKHYLQLEDNVRDHPERHNVTEILEDLKDVCTVLENYDFTAWR